MRYNFFAKNLDNLQFEWNAVSEKEWPTIKRNFVAAYLCAYMEQAPPNLGEHFAKQAHLLWDDACKLPEEDAFNHLMSSLIKPLQFYLYYENNLLHYENNCLQNEINALKEYLANPQKEIASVKQQLINLFKIKCYFEEAFDKEKDRINNCDKINYLILRFHGQPIAFFTCELNYKSGYTYLRFINISPAFNRLGLSTIILNKVNQYFYDSLGLELYARKDNKAARAFYKSCGFQEFETFDFAEPSYPKERILHFPNDDTTEEPEEHIGFQRRTCS